jgi:nitrate reductase gamma subunit
MESFLNLLRGPVLVLAFTVFLLGVARLLVLAVVELVRAYRKAGDQVVPWGFLFRRSLGWIFPVNAMRGARTFYTVASLVFHVGMLVVPLFLAGHVALIQKGLGIAWPALPAPAADLLTLAALAALFFLVLARLVDRASRTLSDVQDWALLALCIAAFLSGYAVAHPEGNPFPFSLTYAAHLLSTELLLILIPFSKLAHAALFPLTRITWEMGWHFVPGSGERVRIALGKEGEPV